MHPLAVTTGRIKLPLSRRLNLNTFAPIMSDSAARPRGKQVKEGSREDVRPQKVDPIVGRVNNIYPKTNSAI